MLNCVGEEGLLGKIGASFVLIGECFICAVFVLLLYL